MLENQIVIILKQCTQCTPSDNCVAMGQFYMLLICYGRQVEKLWYSCISEWIKKSGFHEIFILHVLIFYEERQSLRLLRLPDPFYFKETPIVNIKCFYFPFGIGINIDHHGWSVKLIQKGFFIYHPGQNKPSPNGKQKYLIFTLGLLVTMSFAYFRNEILSYPPAVPLLTCTESVVYQPYPSSGRFHHTCVLHLLSQYTSDFST